MDDTLIFVKTLAGERAILERTRLVQRNLRMVLILVERHSSVADLKAKIGGSIIVESALAELEQMGLIERLENRRRNGAQPAIDPVPIASPPPLSTAFSLAPVEAEDGALEAVALTAADEAIPASTGSSFATAESTEEKPLAVDTIFEPFEAVAAELNDSHIELNSAAESDEPAEAPRQSSLAARIQAWRERRAAIREEQQFDKVYRDEPSEPIDMKPLRQRGRKKSNARAWAIGLIGFFAAVPLFLIAFPYGSYAPEIAASASAALHSPVRFEAVRFSFTPYPNLTLQGIEIGGSQAYATIAEAHLVPDPLAFFSAAPMLQFVELDQVRLRAAGIDRVTQWLSGGDAGWRVKRGRVNDLSVELGGEVAGPLGGDLLFSAEGTLAKVMLSSSTTRVEAIPAGKRFRLSLTSDALTLPSQPPLQVSELTGAGELTPQQLRLGEISARFYDGRLEGKMTIDWSKDFSMSGDFELKRTGMGKLIAAFSPESSFEGELAGKLHIEGRAKNLAGLGDDISIDGSFIGQRVAINRFGLVDAAVSTGRESIRSGTTRLDNLGGTLQCDRSSCRIGNLSMTSGVMRANGQANVTRSAGKLDGVLQVELQRSASMTNAQVSLQGSLAFPELKRR